MSIRSTDETSAQGYLRRSLRHPVVARLAATRRHETPHQCGKVVWHEWGTGPTVVLLHGGFGSWLHWVRTIDSLTPRFRVLAADLPGLGESDALGDGPLTAAAVAEPLVQGLEQLLVPGEPLRIAAFSLGAVIGSQVAAAMRPRLSRIVLLGPSGLGSMWRTVTGELTRRHPDMTEDERRAAVRQNLEHSMIAAPQSVDALAIDVQLDLVQQRRRLRGLPISMSDALIAVLPDLAPRATVVWGEHDRYLAPDLRTVVETLRARLPELDVRIVPGAGHWVAYEGASEINPMLIELFSRSEPVQ